MGQHAEVFVQRNPIDRIQQLMFQIKVLEGMHSLNDHYEQFLASAKQELETLEARHAKTIQNTDDLLQVHAAQRDLIESARKRGASVER